MNLSNAQTTYVLEGSSDSTQFRTIGQLATAATSGTGNPVTLQEVPNYIRVRLSSKGTGDVIFAVSGYNYTNKGTSAKAVPSNIPYTIVQDVASSTITYIGMAKSIFVPATNTGYALFRVIRITYDVDGNMTATESADGDSEEDNIWSNRAALTYK
jgi:hypothetical protein